MVETSASFEARYAPLSHPYRRLDISHDFDFSRHESENVVLLRLDRYDLDDWRSAFGYDDRLARHLVLSWINAAADSDLLTLSKLYRLTGEGYYRIQPELGRGPTCALIQRYLLGCIRDGVADNDEIQERYEAAETLHVWFRHLAKMEGAILVVAAAANGLMKLYFESGEDVRVAIENGFLEHALETAAVRPYFEQWGSDPRLQVAWKRALEWGDGRGGRCAVRACHNSFEFSILGADPR